MSSFTSEWPFPGDSGGVKSDDDKAKTRGGLLEIGVSMVSDTFVVQSAAIPPAVLSAFRLEACRFILRENQVRSAVVSVPSS